MVLKDKTDKLLTFIRNNIKNIYTKYNQGINPVSLYNDAKNINKTIKK